jgi:hypothetical protein
VCEPFPLGVGHDIVMLHPALNPMLSNEFK